MYDPLPMPVPECLPGEPTDAPPGSEGKIRVLIERAARYIESKDKGDKTFGGRKYADIPDAKRRDLQIKLLPWLRGQLAFSRDAQRSAPRPLSFRLGFRRRGLGVLAPLGQ